MDNNLKVLDLYNNSDNKRVDNFNKNVHSEYKIESEYEKVEVNFDWLDLMEDTVRYIDNILRNPNRFIINEEEVVKVEQAKRVMEDKRNHTLAQIEEAEEVLSKSKNIQDEGLPF